MLPAVNTTYASSAEALFGIYPQQQQHQQQYHQYNQQAMLSGTSQQDRSLGAIFGASGDAAELSGLGMPPRHDASLSLSGGHGTGTPMAAVHAMPRAAAAAAVPPLPRVVHARAPHAPGGVFVVPRGRVTQWPAGVATTALPTMCISYFESAACPFGDECHMLHARGRGVRRCDAHVGPHVDPAWAPARHHHRQQQNQLQADVAEHCVPVAFPGDAGRTELLQPTACLPTKGFEREQPAHCVHYLRKGLCLLGAECQFVHAASLSHTAVVWLSTQASGPLRRSPTQAHQAAPLRRSPFRHTPYAPRPASPEDVAAQRSAQSATIAAHRAQLPASLPAA